MGGRGDATYLGGTKLFFSQSEKEDNMTITRSLLRGFSKSTRVALGPFASFFFALTFTPQAHAGGVVSVCDDASLQAVAL